VARLIGLNRVHANYLSFTHRRSSAEVAASSATLAICGRGDLRKLRLASFLRRMSPYLALFRRRSLVRWTAGSGGNLEVGQLEADGPAGLALPDCGAVDGVAVGRDVIDTQRHQVAAAQLAVMARLNRARSRVRPSSCNFARMDHTWPGRSGGFGPVSLPLLRAGRGASPGDDGGELSFMVGLPC